MIASLCRTISEVKLVKLKCSSASDELLKVIFIGVRFSFNF
jgi:hypothetical protein